MIGSCQGPISIEPGKPHRGPTIRGLRIILGDELGWFATGTTPAEVVADFPELTEADICDALTIADDRERRLLAAGRGCSSIRT